MSVVSMSAESVDSNEAYDEERQIRTQVWQILREQALDILKREPCLAPLINEATLDHASFGDALMFRLATKLAGRLLPPEFYMNVFRDCWGQAGTLLERLAMEDMIAVEQRVRTNNEHGHIIVWCHGGHRTAHPHTSLLL
jgi:hypothetical protein